MEHINSIAARIKKLEGSRAQAAGRAYVIDQAAGESIKDYPDTIRNNPDNVFILDDI